MKRHTFDPLSMTAGVIFLLLAATAAGGTRFNYRLDEWVFPAALLVLGIALLSIALRGVKSERLADAMAAEVDGDEDEPSID